MGPPSEDDGKEVGVMTGIKSVELQWGRRPRTTESPQSRDGLPVPRHASMGPPSEDDGKTLSPYESQSPRRCCFNGAAVRGRRKGIAKQHDRRAQRCFNGAAVRGRRKVASSRVNAVGKDASMGPPSEDDGKQEKYAWNMVHGKRLQWGRRPRTTESLG